MKIFRKALRVTFDSLVKRFRGDLIKASQISVQHYLVTSYQIDAARNHFRRHGEIPRAPICRSLKHAVVLAENQL
jgi:hypothetical protein